MKNNQPHTITIAQFRKASIGMGAYYGTEILVSSGVPDLDRFRTPTRIDAFTVLVCTGGDTDITINLRHHRLRRDDVLINYPEDILHLQDSHNLSGFAVLLSPMFLNALRLDSVRLSSYGINRRSTVMTIPPDRTRVLQTYYDLMRDAIAGSSSETADILHSLCSAFCSVLISLRRQYLSDTAATGNDGAVSRGQRLFNRFMAVLQQYHTTERSLGFYAGRLCVTPNYLSCSVKEHTGRTAAQWINDYVVLEAKIMLQTSDLSIQEIASRLNFVSQSALGKYFKQQTGLSPSRYRKESRSPGKN